jgi:hypothetical protein
MDDLQEYKLKKGVLVKIDGIPFELMESVTVRGYMLPKSDDTRCDGTERMRGKTMKLPEDFDLSEAKCAPFSGRVEDAVPSRRWTLEQAGVFAEMLDGLPCGVALLILDEAKHMVNRQIDHVMFEAMKAVWVSSTIPLEWDVSKRRFFDE